MGSCLGNNARLGWEEGAEGFWHVENECLFLMLLQAVWGWGLRVVVLGFFFLPPSPFFPPAVVN